MIIAFNVKNIQDDYGRCLSLIKACELLKQNINEKNINDTREIINSIRNNKNDDFIKISYKSFRGSYKYLEQPLYTKNGEIAPSVFDMNILSADSLNNIDFINSFDEMHYHIRVHFDYKDNMIQDIINLQFLSQMLLDLDKYNFFDEKTKKKLTIFMVPASGEYYPFNQNGNVDNVIYDKVSTYLRLLAKRYNGVLFGVNFKNNLPSVEAVNFRKNELYGDYLPLIVVDDENYDKLFSYKIDKKTIDTLFSLKKGHRFGMSRDENPKVACVDFLLEASLFHLKGKIDSNVNNGMDIYTEIRGMLVDGDSLSAIEFCLFSYLFTKPKYCSEVLKTAKDLCDGLKQVVQNSLQYSVTKTCLFSFVLHKPYKSETNEDFVARMSNLYSGFKINNDEYSALEVYVSDYNDTQNIIDNFVDRLNHENNTIYCKKGNNGHVELINKRDDLEICNFFNEFNNDDIKNSWAKFRQEDMVAHVGLSLFKITAKRCNAAIKYISSKNIILDKRNYYYEYLGDDSKGLNEIENNINFVVPGTQLSVLLPIQHTIQEDKSGFGQLLDKNAITEDYKCFAKYLNYCERKIEHKRKNNTDYAGFNENKKITDSEDKEKLVYKWFYFWNAKFEEDLNEMKFYLHNHDFKFICNDEYFANKDNIELCIKGLLLSIGTFDFGNNDVFLAFTNMPNGTIVILKSICLALELCKFPSNIQLCISESDHKNFVILMGNTYKSAIYNSYILSLEYGTEGFEIQDFGKGIFSEMSDTDHEKKEKIITTKIFPFDCILKTDVNKTYFEERIQYMVENDLDDDPAGFKINNTHMKLGSKVHTESFYEMSFLFYRTSVANRIAFLLLRRIKENSKNNILNIENDNILFYGYASYSKAILTSVVEILKEYRKEDKRGIVGYASYQHNLQSISDSVQMYYRIDERSFPAKVNEKNQLELSDAVKIIQIVPISSTLTTFSKMYDMFLSNVVNDKNAYLVANYTVFWVFDKQQNGILPSDIEKNYWMRNDYVKRNIETKLKVLEVAGMPTVLYFMRSPIVWHDPISCELCYPKIRYNELPLVETDATSTVPSQQIRRFRKSTIDQLPTTNNLRILDLHGCVYYGHIFRRQNHYQYYIDTQKYFHKSSNKVEEWLRTLKDNAIENNDYYNSQLNIIFSPEHNTNVGFAQYVNTYYFNGLAEVVSLDIDKEFRSNFVCENWSLRSMIKKLLDETKDESEKPVSFYFVDDTIITGETFYKANSFLHSLLPEEYLYKFGATLFSKVFVLMDRLSKDTKKNYVNNVDDFWAYVHIDVSNIRTNGDSCIGCKLSNDANEMFRKSGTKVLSDYWNKKITSYKKIAYDDYEKMADKNSEDSFRKLIVSHLLQNIVVKNGNAYEIGNAFDVLLDICIFLLDDSHKCKYENDILLYGELLKIVKGAEGVKTIFKIICRPFFSFDFKIKRQVMTLYICVTEMIVSQNMGIDNNQENELLNEERISRIIYFVNKLKETFEENEEMIFLEKYLIEGLTDIGSNFIIRKDTISNIYKYIEDYEFGDKCIFWNNYAANIHRLVNNSGDETKKLWIEYLFLTGNEIDQNSLKDNCKYVQPEFLFETITGNKLPTDKNKFFYQFCHNVFIQNMEVNFDGLEKINDNRENNDSYFMDTWEKLRNLNYTIVGVENKKEEKCERELFKKLNPINGDLLNNNILNSQEDVNEWYQNFVNLIKGMINEKYNIDSENVDVAILTKNSEDDQVDIIQKYEIVVNSLGSNTGSRSRVLFKIKDRILHIDENSKNKSFDLDRIGYYISDLDEPESHRPYIIIQFDNPPSDSKENIGRTMQWIDKVFLYVSIKENNKNEFYVLRFILRDILTFRNRIMRFLEKDFSGGILARYSRTSAENNILSHEKANSHNTTSDDVVSLEIFLNEKQFDKNGDYTFLTKEKATEWLLLRNYVNNQIAKIFNRSFRTFNHSYINTSSPLLYIPESFDDNGKNVFGHKLDFFYKLNLKNKKNEFYDERMKMLNEIIIIDYDDELENAKFIKGLGDEYYNIEYFKCIIIDMLFSALKYEVMQFDYLHRINRIYEIQHKLNNVVDSWYKDDMAESLIKDMNKSLCKVTFNREQSDNSMVDYLVIRNSVEYRAHNIKNWQECNTIIQQRLRDPLDYADGHMSMLTIKRYIEKIEIVDNLECEFKYIYDEESDLLYFENKLPVLRRE